MKSFDGTPLILFDQNIPFVIEELQILYFKDVSVQIEIYAEASF